MTNEDTKLNLEREVSFRLDNSIEIIRYNAGRELDALRTFKDISEERGLGPELTGIMLYEIVAQMVDGEMRGPYNEK